MMPFLESYRALVAERALAPDAAQQKAAAKLDALARALNSYKARSWLPFKKPSPPRGLYIWGDVGRGKSMLMDLFFEAARTSKKRRVHFNAFMVETHGRIHAERQKGESVDPIPPVARVIAEEAQLLCFDEFQVTDVADAMILGRLFEQLFSLGVVIVATSNTEPQKLYEGGLNRALFLPFIALIENRLDIINLDGGIDYRLQRMAGMKVYITPLGPEACRAMDEDWRKLTGGEDGEPLELSVLGRKLKVPKAAQSVARFSFDELCAAALGAADYLAIAETFHTVMIDSIPVMGPAMRNEARRFMLLIDTLYDENVKLVCSAAAPPHALYTDGDGADAFRRTVSRLMEMQSADYLAHGHKVEVPGADID